MGSVERSLNSYYSEQERAEELWHACETVMCRGCGADLEKDEVPEEDITSEMNGPDEMRLYTWCSLCEAK